MNPLTFMPFMPLMHRLRRLNDRHPASWPPAFRILMLASAFLLALLSGWQLHLASIIESLATGEQQAHALETAGVRKLQQIRLLPLQLEQVHRLERAIAGFDSDLPAENDTSALLGDIGAAAVRHRLQFEFARPETPQTGPTGIMLSIAVRLDGNYHDIGRFAADIAAMPRALILDGLRMSSGPEPGRATLEASLLAYRRNPAVPGAPQERAQIPEDIQAASGQIFIPHAYRQTRAETPFGHLATVADDKHERRPPQRGRKQYLEDFPLDSMRMVGTLSRDGSVLGLVMIDRIVHPVRSGDYAGKNFGRIRHISETGIELEELFPAAGDNWEKRLVTLPLQGTEK